MDLNTMVNLAKTERISPEDWRETIALDGCEIASLRKAELTHTQICTLFVRMSRLLPHDCKRIPQDVLDVFAEKQKRWSAKWTGLQGSFLVGLFLIALELEKEQLQPELRIAAEDYEKELFRCLPQLILASVRFEYLDEIDQDLFQAVKAYLKTKPERKERYLKVVREVRSLMVAHSILSLERLGENLHEDVLFAIFDSLFPQERSRLILTLDESPLSAIA